MKIFGILCLTSLAAFASINNCPNATVATAVNNGTTAPSSTIAGAGPGNDFTSVNAINGPGAGCTAIDLTFNNFVVFNSPGNFNANGAITNATTYLAETPSGTGNNPLTNPDTLLFSSVRGANAGTTTDGANNDQKNNFFKALNTNTINDDIAFVVTSAPGSAMYGITVVINNPGVGAGASGTFQLNVCAGGSDTGVITGACGTGTQFTSVLFALSSAASQTFSLSFGGPVTYADVTTIFTLNGTAGGNAAGFASFSEQIAESPEPSTFVLMGSAITLLGFMQYYRRRVAAHRA